MPRKNDITIEYLRECFDLDEVRGVLTWKVRPDYHFFSVKRAELWNRVSAGKPGGALTGSVENGGPRYIVKIKGHRYLVARIVFAMHHGLNLFDVPAVVDHKNRITTDNRPGNLRAATYSQNSINTGLSQRNTSGYRGVSYCKNGKKWRAMIHVDKRKICLGNFKNIEDAAEAYRESAVFHYGEYASPCSES